ncbi:MAG TPA: ABC transporter ATP-binding protein [Phycisphaerae bacterium]|nr:ABC transporter ATP-binding protein [Phycisphaerae bacterium]HUT56734.1 ABC transporter ATP-binding protein [Phycisphaerae bacterium]
MVEMDTGVVVTRGLTKIFRDFWLREKVTAVSGLDLDVHPREVFGLLGPNGSGKSTTLKMILGLLFPTRGQIAVLGRPPTDVAVKARIGFLPEESYLYPFLDARETLDFYGRLFHQSSRQRRQRTDMLLEMVGLSAVAYRRVGEYSKGMQRRIGLAQALINDPDLLILDEPTSGMDPIGTRQFKDLIRTLAARGKTVIISSHLLADVEDVCDRVCVLYGGQKRALGRLDELLAQGGLTQITTDQLDEQSLQDVRKALAGSGRDIRQVTTPRDKLESLFLRIVEEAQAQRLVTGGVTAGGEVAEFLRGEGDQQAGVIEQLVSAAAAEPPEEQVAEPQPVPQPAPQEPEQVLDELVVSTAEGDQGPQPPTQPQRPAPQADRSVIDELLRKRGDQEQS